MKKFYSVCLGVGGLTGKGHEKLSGEMETFYIMKAEEVSSVHLSLSMLYS